MLDFHIPLTNSSQWHVTRMLKVTCFQLYFEWVSKAKKQQVVTIYPHKKNIDTTVYIHVVQLQNTVWMRSPKSGSKSLLGNLSQNGTSSFFSDGAQLQNMTLAHK
jgi:hypothetical protein